ncbi:TPA: hypothetical protein O7P31_004515, partial [Escherichia coli]|nr:hypothetical protein [Escherichia coli]
DADNYADTVEISAGSDQNSKTSTPKTIAEELYEEARLYKESLEKEKVEAGNNGYTISEVNIFERESQKLDDLKSEVINKLSYVNENDGKDELLDKVRQLVFDIPKVTDTADSVWDNSRDIKLLRNYESSDIMDLSGQNTISGSLVTVRNPDIGNIVSSLKGPTDWTYSEAAPSQQGGGYIQYRVDENHQLIFRIVDSKAQYLNGITQEKLTVLTEDDTKLTLFLTFKGNFNESAIDSIYFNDDRGSITGAISKAGSITDDNFIDKITVNLKGSLSEKQQKIALSIEKLDDHSVLSFDKAISSDGKVVFDINQMLDDGTYSIKARFESNDGSHTSHWSSLDNITVDTVRPSVNIDILPTAEDGVRISAHEIDSTSTIYGTYELSHNQNDEIQRANTLASHDTWKTNSRVDISMDSFLSGNTEYYVSDVAGNIVKVQPYETVKLSVSSGILSGTLGLTQDSDNLHLGGVISNLDLDAKAGDDVIDIDILNDEKGNISLGKGDDILTLNGPIMHGDRDSSLQIDFGAGSDQLVLKSSYNSLDMFIHKGNANISNVEFIKLDGNDNTINIGDISSHKEQRFEGNSILIYQGEGESNHVNLSRSGWNSVSQKAPEQTPVVGDTEKEYGTNHQVFYNHSSGIYLYIEEGIDIHLV